MKHVIWPALLLESVVFIILSVWTSKTDYGWERAYIDEATGESIAKCADGMDELQFWIPIALLAMIPTLLTGIMAWKTIDVDAAYSEAKWIFALMLVHFQVSVRVALIPRKGKTRLSQPDSHCSHAGLLGCYAFDRYFGGCFHRWSLSWRGDDSVDVSNHHHGK